MDKAPDAFRTISEVAGELDIPQHVLRFWETRFSQIKPMKRSGGRRFYRPDDVDLLRGIRRLLYGEGYTIRGVQRILKEQGIKSVQALRDTTRAVPSLYGLDDGVKTKLARDEGVTYRDDAQDDTPESEPVAPSPPPRRPMATPLPRMDLPPVDLPRVDLPRMDLPRMDLDPDAGAAMDSDAAPDVGDDVETRVEHRSELHGDMPARPPAPSLDRAASFAAPDARVPSAAPSKPDRRPLDIIRLKAVMSDLIVCREMLDRALQDG